MKQTEFERYHSDFWDSCARSFSILFDHKQKKQLGQQRFSEVTRSIPKNYSTLCQHLAIAKSRRYTPVLIERLNQLVRQGYEILYASKYRRSDQLLEFIVYGFPNTLRANSTFILTSTLLFVVPGLLMGLASYLNDTFLYSLMDPAQIRSAESMYDPQTSKLGRERQSDSDLMMFGFYIQNNIGISFRCFASGIFFGLGSVYFLIYNGLFIGGIAGHLTQEGFSETFYPFVIGHGAFELTAIIFSGAAGLKLGFALIDPGSYARLSALQMAAKEAIKIIYGSTLLLLIAAFIEAYWSSSSQLSIAVKLSVGALFWFLVIYYCFFSGRRRGY